MSKKNLLNENTVRRFMKLAEIEPLTGQFVKKLNEGSYMDDEEGDGSDERRDAAEALSQDLESLDLEGAEEEEYDGLDEYDMMDDKGASDLDDAMGEEYDGLDEYDMMDDEGDDYDEEETIGNVAAALEEEMRRFLAEQEEAEEPEEDDMQLDAEEDDMEMEGPAEPAMGGLDPEELKEMVKDAVMDALEALVKDGAISVDDEGEEEVDVDGAEEDDDMGMEEEEEEEEVVNEVARRVMKRILNSRRRR